MQRLEYDLAILNEIHDQVAQAQGDAKKDGASMEARRKQRRNKAQQSITDGEAIELLKQGGFIQ